VFAPQGVDIDEDAIKAAVPKARKVLKLLEAALEGSEWFAGDRLSLADLAIAPVVFYAGLVPEGPALFEGLPNLIAWKSRMMERPSFGANAPPQG
jgi:glutathione S-transferase